MALVTASGFLSAKSHTARSSIAAPIDMSRIATLILGGGQGTRLFPLTATRCKPAICFGGRYRLIDVPVSNAINSDCLKIFIVTQFLSSSIHRHISQTYHLGAFSNGFIEVLAAEQRPEQKEWYQGTADAVRQNLCYLVEVAADYFLILSGDQLYNMDFRKMVQFAQEKDADVVIASLPVDADTAKRMGILKVDKDDFITDFLEKPQDLALIQQMETPASVLEKVDILSDSPRRYLGSMGIYLFKRNVLLKLLHEDKGDDFGKHLIPLLVQRKRTAAFLFDGYWEDIGTIESFYQANIALTQPYSAFDYYNECRPIFTSPYVLPGPKISKTQIHHSVICEGSIVEAEEISNSILGPRTLIKKGCVVRDSYLMGNDFYNPPVDDLAYFPKELMIGERCVIQKTIIDKNVHIGKGVQLINQNKLMHYNGDNIYIRDGIIVVTRGAHLPDGFVL